MTTEPDAPEDRRTALLRWAVVAAVPALAFLIGAIALPRPAAVSDVDRPDAQPADLAGVVSRTPPRPGHGVDAVLGNAIRIHGADLPKGPVAPGERLSLRCYFEALAGIDQDWQIFLHIDAQQGSYRIHGDHFPARGRYSTTLWQKGEVIADDWSGAVPRDAPAGSYDLWLGFYIGDERLPFSGGDRSVHDGVNRVRVGTITVQ